MASNGIKRIIPRSRVEEVKNKVGIPEYFESVILPQMGSYYDLYPVDFDNKPVVCCPIHDEDTPSFRFYPDTKSFYCFGCQKGGNVITLHRYFIESITGTQPSYDESVDYLYNLFISGKAIENAPIQTELKQEKRSTDKELLAFNMYRVDTEASIMVDKTIPEETKLHLCDMFDKVDVLIDKDIVNATEARDWMRQLVKSSLKAALA